MFKLFVFLAVCAFIVAVYFTLTAKTTIIFQTSCGAFFYTDVPRLDNGTSGFKYTPTIQKFYNAKDLALEMTTQASAVDFPLTVTFQDGRFHISSPLVLRVTDTEYTTNDNVIDGVYVGARYGEAKRFLNHLMIVCEISYPPPYDPGQIFTRLHSTRRLTNALIGNDPIPPAPLQVTNSLNSTNDLLIDVQWIAPPNITYTVGIYLQNSSVPPAHIENWDLMSDQDVTSFSIANLTPGDTYLCGASFIGRYDESSPTMASGSGIPIPQPSGLTTFDLLAAGTLNTETRFITPNQQVSILDMSGVDWPVGLGAVNQIKSINVKFYSSINQFSGGPSDSRITFGNDGPVIFYAYWRFVEKLLTDNSDLPQAFASVLNTPRGTTGPLDALLNYDTLIISDPNVISNMFPNFGAGPISVYMFCGYPGTSLRINDGVPVLEKFELLWE